MNAYFPKLSAWFLKESGKNAVFVVATVTSIGIGACHLVPHTFLLDQYQEVVHLYKNGFTVPTPQKLKQRFNRTVELLEIPNEDKHLYRPFMVFGFDIFSAGSSYSKYGVAIGLPINYTYIDEEVIDKSGIKVNDCSVPWDLEEGRQLLSSLTVGEKAQMYAIAREIKMRDTPKYFTDMIGGVASFILAYIVGQNLNKKYNLFAKPRSTRVLLYSLLGTFSLWNYVFLKDFSQVYYERKVDESLVKKSPIFREGGEQFYAKLLARNIALRKLLGKAGESCYTSLGDVNYLIRQKHLPLPQRKTFFESKLESI